MVVLSARDESRDKVEALDLGRDDYVTKPFGLDELSRASGPRAAEPGSDLPVVEAGSLTIDVPARQVTRNGAVVRLTPRSGACLRCWCAVPVGW